MRFQKRKYDQKVVKLTENLDKIGFDRNTAKFYGWGYGGDLQILQADEPKTETNKKGEVKSLVITFQIDRKYYPKKIDNDKKTQFGVFASGRTFKLQWWFQNDHPADKEGDGKSQYFSEDEDVAGIV